VNTLPRRGTSMIKLHKSLHAQDSKTRNEHKSKREQSVYEQQRGQSRQIAVLHGLTQT